MDKKHQRGKKTATHSLFESAKSLAYGFAIFLVIRAFLIQTWVITSGSMEHTLLVGDLLVLNKVAYGATVPLTHYRLPGYTHPQHGDVIVFRAQHDTLDLIKRLVGVPGDTLQMKKGELFVNGRKQFEPYVEHTDPAGDGTDPWMQWQKHFLTSDVDTAKYLPTRDNWGPLVVPPGRFFVMGDNRDDSLDSRFWGLLDPGRVKGKAGIVYYSYDRDAVRPFSWLHPRWQRIGSLIR
jgi:signal peptidase I